MATAGLRLMAAKAFAAKSVKAPSPKTDSALVIPEEEAPTLTTPAGPLPCPDAAGSVRGFDV